MEHNLEPMPRSDLDEELAIMAHKERRAREYLRVRSQCEQQIRVLVDEYLYGRLVPSPFPSAPMANVALMGDVMRTIDRYAEELRARFG